MSPTFSYVLPVHNQEAVLESSVQSLCHRLQQHPGSEIVLVENGSPDGSLARCWSLAADAGDATVRISLATSDTGLGCALRRGMELAGGDVIVLTAADLPFGLSDLDAFLAETPQPSFAIGSKAHPESVTETALQRRAMSEAFRWARRGVLGLNVRDSQGTIFVNASLRDRILPRLECTDFLISTEITCWAVREGATPLELPVTYPRSTSSTVSPLRDSARMFAGMVSLRRRLREGTPVAPALQKT